MMSRSTGIALGLASALVLASCSAPSSFRSTRYTASDMEIAKDEIIEQLSGSDFLASRDTESPKMVLVASELENRSNDRISRVDKWAALTRIFTEPSVLRLLRSKNIEFVLPPEQSWLMRRFEVMPNSAETEKPSESGSVLRAVSNESNSEPTHVVTGRFSSLTRAGSTGEESDVADTRKDLFLIDYTIRDIRSREMLWSGTAEFARVASGRLVD